jgi:hypothetical protein
MCKRRFGGKPVVFRRDPVAKAGVGSDAGD